MNSAAIQNIDKEVSCQQCDKFKFIDLFAGIGGFHLALHSLGMECVFASEWDECARKTYSHNLKKISPELFNSGNFAGDIQLIDLKDIPQFDILCAGFPCQPFSQAGFKKGFNDTRGTLFHNIAKIIEYHQPAAFFLENVRHLLNHDSGKTFSVIKDTIENRLGYSFYYRVIKASDFGLPQHRPRLFMVGFEKNQDFSFPEPQPLIKSMSDIFNAQCEKKIGFTLRVGGRGSPIHDRRNWDSYLVNNEVRRITPIEGRKMQGFPDDFDFPVSETQAMKQLGNSVAVPAVKAIAREMMKALRQ